MRGKRFWTRAIAALVLMTAAAGYASAQEKTPTATPSAAHELPLAAIPDGTWLIGKEVSPGLYSASGGAQCSWQRLSGFGGTSDDVIASDFGAVRPIVEIFATDKGFTTKGCGQWTLVELSSTETPTSNPTSTSIPTNTPIRVPTATPVPKPVVTIPQGWSTIENDRLGYSLAVPPGWLIVDLHSDQWDRLRDIICRLNCDAAKELEEFLATPAGKNAGHLAVGLSIFKWPPITSLAAVGITSLSDDTSPEDVIDLLRGLIESNEMLPVTVQSLEPGITNNLPSIQGVVTADLSSQGLFNAHAAITALRANDTAYILFVAVPADQAKKEQQMIDQIVGSFRPDIRSPTPTPSASPTPTPSASPTATPTPLPPPPCPLGENVQVGDMHWCVLAAEDLGHELRINGDSETTEGRFILVRFQFQNLGRAPLKFWYGPSRKTRGAPLRDGQGREFPYYLVPQRFRPDRPPLEFIPDDEECYGNWSWGRWRPYVLKLNILTTCTIIYEVDLDATGLVFIASDLNENRDGKPEEVDLKLP